MPPMKYLIRAISVSAALVFFATAAVADHNYPPAPIAPIAPNCPIAPIYPVGPHMFPVQSSVWVQPYQVTVGVANYSGRPISCQGQIQTWGAYTGGSWMNFLIGPVFPGNWGYFYVNPYYGDYFVNGQAYVYCWYL
jgi:hypothetical protein